MSLGARRAYGHGYRRIGPDHYRLEWVIDRKYTGSRLRFPTAYTRDTDFEGAKRFAKKWDIQPPTEAASSPTPEEPGTADGRQEPSGSQRQDGS